MNMPAVLKSAIVQMLLWLAFFSIDAQAEINNSGVLDNVLARYAAAASAWAGVITARASFLFWTLAVISMVWTFGMLALRKADLGDFYAEFFGSRCSPASSGGCSPTARASPRTSWIPCAHSAAWLPEQAPC
jgi:hypothetical protein